MKKLILIQCLRHLMREIGVKAKILKLWNSVNQLMRQMKILKNIIIKVKLYNLN